MAVISGFLAETGERRGGYASDPHITGDLRDYSGLHYPPVGQIAGDIYAPGLVSQLPVSAAPIAISGFKQQTYFDDFYERIHVIPAGASAGNVVTPKEVPVLFWNGHLSSRTLSAITFTDASGVTVDSEPLPWVMMPLREYTFVFTFAALGEATVNGSALFDFNGTADDKIVPVTAQRVAACILRPDWTRGVLERLEWLTDVITAYDGSEQRIVLRRLPRRSFEFDYVAIGAAERRRFENMLFAWGSMPWAVPIWTDGTNLQAPLNAGALSIPIETTTSDYVAGGIAIIIGQDGDHEVVGVLSVNPSNIMLDAPTRLAWDAGTSVYPARLGVMDTSHRVSRFTGDSLYSTIKFRLTDDSEVAAATAATYRNYPVLEQSPVWRRDLTTEYKRVLEAVDFGVGGFTSEDETELPTMLQAHHWTLTSKADAEAFRQFLYARRGKAKAIWVPTFLHDMQLASDIDIGDITIDVDNCLYTQFIGAAKNRRDIQIKLRNGTTYYRRIVSSFENTATVERLTMDAVISDPILVADVERISFMMLARLDSDTVELSWWTDDVAEVTANFRSINDGI